VCVGVGVLFGWGVCCKFGLVLFVLRRASVGAAWVSVGVWFGCVGGGVGWWWCLS